MTTNMKSDARSFPPKFDVPDHLYPFEHKYLHWEDGTRIHYVDEGEGELLLMLHGNPTWSFLYRKMITKLRDSFRCVALDYPSFGLSEARPGFSFLPRDHSQVVERFVDELGLKEITFIVQDWGGPIGLGLAGRRPELAKRFVIGNTWAWPLVGETRIELFSWMMGGPIGRAMALGFNGVARYFFRDGFVNKLEPEILHYYLAPFADRRNRRQTSIFPRQLIKADAYLKEVEQGLQTVADRPVLFAWGTEDFAFREAEREKFQTIFPNHETVLLYASHFWQDDRADEAADAIIKWSATGHIS